MNPHFVYNALNAIQFFILSSQADEAVQYLGYLGSIIRSNLENLSEEFIPIVDEINFLQKYVALEQMRFSRRLEVEIINEAGEDKIMIPPMIVQPVVENSIKHGLQNLDKPGRIKVRFAAMNNHLQVSVEDNGIGRDAAGASVGSEHKSMGTSLIRQRLDLLNQKFSNDLHRLEIVDLYNDGAAVGTLVMITLQVVRSA